MEDVKRMLRENVTIQRRPERNCEGLHFVRNRILGEGMQGGYSLIEEECVWLLWLFGVIFRYGAQTEIKTGRYLPLCGGIFPFFISFFDFQRRSCLSCRKVLTIVDQRKNAHML